MKEELEVIMDLMKELQSKMEYGEDDFNERLGRSKPSIDVVKVEASPIAEEEVEEEMVDGMDDFEEPESPEEKLKKRLLKLRS